MPQFSVIAVYNDAETLREWLQDSLENQSHEHHERIFVDNRDSQFSSAAAALILTAESFSR